MSRNNRLSAIALMLALTLVFSHWSFAAPYNANRDINEDPSALAMTADLVVVRPAMLTFTILGSAVWLVALPFTAAGGNIKQSAKTLVVGPAKNTFVRCLGCTKPGYKQTIYEE